MCITFVVPVANASSPQHSRSANVTVCRRKLLPLAALALASVPLAAHSREGVNRPDLLPEQYTPVLDLEHFLTRGEVSRLLDTISNIESATGYKLRILTQRFPYTPGLAVRDFWQVDDRTVVMVADYFGGEQLLKFNVGKQVDTILPNRFWTLLVSSLGNKFYVRKNGEGAAIVKAVDNIRTCLMKGGCASPPDLRDTV